MALFAWDLLTMQIDVCVGPNPENIYKCSTILHLSFFYILAMILFNIFNWLCIFVHDATFSSYKRLVLILHSLHMQ